MKIDQKLVDEIIERARKSNYGLSEGNTDKAGHLQIKHYHPQNCEALALCLVNGFHAKYDLVSVFRAALEIYQRQSEELALFATHLMNKHSVEEIGEITKKVMTKMERYNAKEK